MYRGTDNIKYIQCQMVRNKTYLYRVDLFSLPVLQQSML